MLRIAQNSVNGKLNRCTCPGTEVAPVQCARGGAKCEPEVKWLLLLLLLLLLFTLF